MSNSLRPSLSPFAHKSISFKNRYVMGSMHTGFEDRLKDMPRLIRYFEARARGGVGLIITGGYSPNRLGALTPFAGVFHSRRVARAHRALTDRVHEHGTKICLQILHAGRYAMHPFLVAPSRLKSPITPFTPFALPTWMVRSTVKDFVRSAELAKEAGYDGVEIMGSEGYFLHQFWSARTNRRKDEYGGSLENRARIAREIVQGIKSATGPEFNVIFRIPVWDGVENGATWEDTLAYANLLESAGVDIFNSGIGWHESRIPTIATLVPRAGFRSIIKEFKARVNRPVIAVNRINTPELADELISDGTADLVSLARPFLADPDFVNKAAQGRSRYINTCIACNQACLDHVFEGKKVSCLVNPEACEENLWERSSDQHKGKKLLVVGAGVAGLAAAREGALRGFQVTVWESASEIGGQFKIAQEIPGKGDYQETLRYFLAESERLGITLECSRPFRETDVESSLKHFDHVVIATGVRPQIPSIPGRDLPHVFNYSDWIQKNPPVESPVVIIGGGGVAVDTAKHVLFKKHDPSLDWTQFFKEWGITPKTAGGITRKRPERSAIELTLIKRSVGAFGKLLGKTTGWAHRAELKRAGVKFIDGVEFKQITPNAVIYERSGESVEHPAKTVILCTGQVPVVPVSEKALLLHRGRIHIVGGAKNAVALDAKRAIREAMTCVRDLTVQK